MEKTGFIVNPLSVIFNPAIDKRNGYSTIVFSWKSKRYIKVNSSGYWILFKINSHPGIQIIELEKELGKKISAVKVFIKQMLEEGIIAEYET